MLPLLKRLADGEEHKFSDLVDELGADFRLTEEELTELLLSGTQPIFPNPRGLSQAVSEKDGTLGCP